MKIQVRRLAPQDFDAELFFLLFSLLAMAFLALAPRDFIALFPCTFKALTGLPCPTCGITRTAFCILQGRLVEAWHTSFFFTSAYLAGGLYAVYCWAVIALKRDRLRITFSGQREFLFLAGVLGLVLAANWIYSICRGI
jgi:hypothetical protein